jgi:transketolase
MRHGIDARVINCHTIKPLDSETILKAAKETGAIVTAEEHQMAGGLGGAISEVVSQNHPVPMRIIGVKDTFGESGESEELMKKYGLKSDDIIKAAKEVLEMRR